MEGKSCSAAQCMFVCGYLNSFDEESKSQNSHFKDIGDQF